jgi:hypothetical protein
MILVMVGMLTPTGIQRSDIVFLILNIQNAEDLFF